jgi:chromosome partitioning protein
MKIVTVATHKGGVGKTTTATTVAAGLAGRGYKTLIVDLDPQGNAGHMLAVRPSDQIWAAVADGEPAPQNTGRLGLDILSSGQRTSWVQSLAPSAYHISAIQEAVLAAGPYDYAVIDTPATSGWLVDAALFAADLLIVPVQLATLAAQAAQEFTRYAAALRTANDLDPLPIVHVPTFRDEGTRIAAHVLLDLQRAGNGTVSTAIHKAAVIEKLSSAQATLYEYRPTNGPDLKALARARTQYNDLIDRIDA